MTAKKWEKKVLDEPGAAKRVAAIEDELRLAAGLTALREQAGLSQRELAKRIGVSQPRITAIEQSQQAVSRVSDGFPSARSRGWEASSTNTQQRRASRRRM
ncbi:MAG: helix-turn-helix transcriptional regulator [Acidimicrobiia bacterium]